MKLVLYLLATIIVQVALSQRLVWQQEFNGGSIDRNTWVFEGGNANGWGNRELEYYTDRWENARIQNNALVIEARREDYAGYHFTSARMKTQGKMEFKYGILEARIRIPQIGRGLWPAFWMMGVGGGQWPKCGEIDILEAGESNAINSGRSNTFVQSTCHWWDYGGNHQADYGQSFNAPYDLSNDFHTYQLRWDRNFIRVFLDSRKIYEMNIANAVNGIETFHQKYYILLNMAVGGNYPNIYDANQINSRFPADLQFEYIRLWQYPGDELYLNGERVLSH